MFMIHELYDIDRPERHLVATEKEVAKSNLTISKLDVLFATLVSGKLHASVQQDLKQGRGQIGIKEEEKKTLAVAKSLFMVKDLLAWMRTSKTT